MEKHEYSLDIIRLLAMCLVIITHIGINPFAGILFAEAFIAAIEYSCNSWFFLLSGYLNLQKEYHCPADYRRYYYSKLRNIFLPFLLFSVIYSLWNLFADHRYVSLRNTVKVIYTDFFQNHADNHMWFMYTFMILLAVTPFLHKIVKNLQQHEKKILVIIAVAYAVLSTYGTALFSIRFRFSTFSWWIIPFLLGYFVPEVSGKKEKILYLLGAAGVLVLTVMRTFFPDRWDMMSPRDLSYMLWTFALFVLMAKRIRITNRILQRILKWLSKYAFYVYLLHWNVLYRIVRPLFAWMPDNTLDLLLETFCTLLISYLLAAVVHFCILHPVQRFCDYIYGKACRKQPS